MELISEDKINEIRNSADIVSIISDYVPLKMQGKNYFGICPFHDDHTPSMSVSKERQLFKCFVCNKGGNVFTFVKEYENINFAEAVKKVADKVGIPLNITYESHKESKFKEEYEIMTFASKIFQNNLNSKEGGKAKEYLKKRSIDDSIIQEFGIGLSLNDKKYLYNVLTKKNYPLKKLEDLGLINTSGIDGYDRFVNRIMIPITNLEGEVVGFTGRIFNNEDSAKYINTKETVIYKKGNILFNYYNAKNYIREEKCAILVEGNMDAIRMYASGVKNVLALMGTNLTKEQISILKKLRVPIILMLDNDAAGEGATVSLGDELLKNNIETKVVRLSGAKDPDEYIVNFGIEAFIDTVKHAINYFDFKLEYLKNNKNLNNTEDLVAYVKSVIKMLDSSDNLTKEITLQKLCNEYHLDYNIIKSEINLKEEKLVKEIKEVSITNNTNTTKYDKCVQKILYYMMSDSKYLKIFNKRLGYLKNENERNLVTEIEYYISKHGKINLADFITYAEGDNKIKGMVNNICGNVLEELDENTFMEYINCLNEILDRENIKKIKDAINNSTDVLEQLENIKKQIAISKKRIDVKKDV